MGYKNDYLPTKCWFENGTLHRAFFEYDDCCYESPRDWCNLSVFVNASSYKLCGKNDEETDDLEQWLINATGINEDWYWSNRERYGGIDGLIKKFRKEKCVAFSYLSVYDHSGICLYSGYCRGWDYSAVGFAYIPKDNDEVKAYRKGHSKEETEKWAEKNLENEIHIMDNYIRGDVYGCVEEVYDPETESWGTENSCWGYYLDDSTTESKEKDAIEIIKEFSGNAKLFDWKDVKKALGDNTLDVLLGQKVFDFMEVA